jgi:hypothetical protein
MNSAFVIVLDSIAKKPGYNPDRQESKRNVRSTLILFVVACGSAFCQDNVSPWLDNLNQKPNGDLNLRLADVLNAQHAQPPVNLVVPRPFSVTASAPLARVCSIPLLNVVAPGKPVPMPNVGQRRVNPFQVNSPNAPRPMDRMSVVAPAPACPANFSQVQTRPVAPPARPTTTP